jgi:hypothetical protein
MGVVLLLNRPLRLAIEAYYLVDTYTLLRKSPRSCLSVSGSVYSATVLLGL